MKIYIKLAFSYLRKQKSRTAFMILGVSLAIMLVFGMNVINESQSKKQLELIYKMYGSYNGYYFNLNKDKIQKIQKDKDVEMAIGITSLGQLISDDGTSIKLNSSDKDYISIEGYQIKKGHLPKEDGEIVLEAQTLKYMNLEETLNQTIKFKVNKEYKDELGINQIFIKEQSFKLVGIITKPKAYYDSFYELKGFTYFKEGKTEILPENLLTYESIIKLKSRASKSKKLNDIRERYNIGRLDFEENKKLTHALDEYNMSKGGKASEDTKKLIIATAIILIYNMFNISLIDMIKQIGLLRVVGTSKKSIRFIIIIQSLFIFIVGMIIGLVLGFGFAYFGMKTFSKSLIEMNVSGSDIYLSSSSIKNALIVGSMTVLISTMIPIWMAGRVSPLEALRKTDKINKYEKVSFHHRIIKKWLGITGEMAYRNMGRNKFRAIVSIIAISIGGMVYIDQIGVVKNNVFSSTDLAMISMSESDFILHKSLNKDPYFSGYSKRDIEDISNINGVSNIKTRTASLGFLKIKTDELQEEYKKYNGILDINNDIEISILLNGYDESYLKMLKDNIQKVGEIDNVEEEYPIVAVYNYYYDILRDHEYKESIKNLNVGDIFTIKVKEIKGNLIKYREQKVRVGAILKKEWGFTEGGKYIEIILPEKTLMDMTNKNTHNTISIEIKDKMDESVYREIKQLFNKDMSVVINSKIELVEENKIWGQERIKVNSIIISLILLISSVNIYGTIKSSLLIRINEFSMLRAIGMTTKQLRKMIITETIIYGLLSSALASILGTYKYYKLVNMLNTRYKEGFNMDNIEPFQLPILQILQYTSITMTICILVGYLSKREIEKLSIVEGLKIIK